MFLKSARGGGAGGAGAAGMVGSGSGGMADGDAVVGVDIVGGMGGSGVINVVTNSFLPSHLQTYSLVHADVLRVLQ